MEQRRIPLRPVGKFRFVIDQAGAERGTSCTLGHGGIATRLGEMDVDVCHARIREQPSDQRFHFTSVTTSASRNMPCASNARSDSNRERNIAGT